MAQYSKTSSQLKWARLSGTVPLLTDLSLTQDCSVTEGSYSKLTAYYEMVPSDYKAEVLLPF